MSLRRHVAMDVSHLPTHTFGSRDLMAWGTYGFIVIEGFSLALAAMVNLYLRRNFSTWPPAGIPHPEWIMPSIQMLVMLLSLLLVRRLSDAAHAHDLHRVQRLLLGAVAVSTVIVALRVWDITQSLNVRWDTNAYGSAQWLVVGTHATLLGIQLYEVGGMAAIFHLGPVEKKHFSDAADIAIYWYFIVLGWIPLYVLCFLLPYWI